MDPSGATSAARFLPLGSAAAEAAGLGPLRHMAVTGSTNADLVAEARSGDAGAAVLVADHQTAGRGRLDRTWDDTAGNALLVSVRLPVRSGAATPGGAGAAVRALGAAGRAAADGLCRDRVLTKWPNDLVVVDGPAPGKLAGVLAAFVDGTAPSVVVGIGINVRPAPTQPQATSIVECGGPADRDALLAALLGELSVRLDDESGVIDELRRHSATLGARVRAELPGGAAVVGEAVDLSDDGELIIRDDDGRDQVVTAGDVVHLRGR